MPFQLESNYKPRGDQGQAIAKLIKSVEAGNRHQTLLGVTGSGKTFTIANVIRELDRPTLVISHNKTLAAQLYSEFKQFFPRNAVEYFVSYFDYYQPEAYIPRSDTYIEKDSSINEEIERLRLAATSALLSRRDTIVVASVSCIYGITSPEDYLKMRTEYDLEMLQEMGFCNGIENYSRHLSGRPPGSKPYTIIDFFPKDFLVVIDESHATIPQIGGMYEGDRSRKTVLVGYGFRLPSALDNRPLNFDEFIKLTNQTIYVSATPAEFEIQNSVVGNMGYIPHKRQRIGVEEIVPFVLPGEKGSAPIDREQAPNSDKRRARAQRSSPNSNVLVSRTDEPPEKFHVHTPGAPLVAEQIIS